MLPVPGLQKTPEADVGHTAKGAVEGAFVVLVMLITRAEAPAGSFTD